VWKQYSYNTAKGVNIKGGKPLRKNGAGIGSTYDPQRDAFIGKKAFNSWILNETTCDWEPPVPRPDDTELYGHKWNEETKNWDQILINKNE
jgi:hypothetical protein